MLFRSSGNVVVTLWLSNSSQLSNPTANFGYGTSSTITITSKNYPANMYSCSEIRVKTLNIGGGYATITNYNNNSAPLTSYSQSASSEWAKFTMPSSTAVGQSSLTDFIITPSEIKYQEIQSSGWQTKLLGTEHENLANEAYGTPAFGSFYNGYGINSNYSAKPGYSDWKNDFIWLPSLSEVGLYQGLRALPTNLSITNPFRGKGIWDLSTNQKNDGTHTWTRSGEIRATGDMPGVIYSDGVYTNWNVGSISSYSVRPALHLNLTAAEAAAGDIAVPEPTATDTVYNGTSQDITTVKPDRKSTRLNSSHS